MPSTYQIALSIFLLFPLLAFIKKFPGKGGRIGKRAMTGGPLSTLPEKQKKQMKYTFALFACMLVSLLSTRLLAQDSSTKHLYIDVHYLEPGKVTYAAVAAAHQKDLAVERKYGVSFIKFWVDSAGGKVYCLSSAPDTMSIRKTHGEAHGLLPGAIYLVTDGPEAPSEGNYFFLDVHKMGPGKVTAQAVAAAHQKDLAVEKKHGVNFVNYWVDEKEGVIMCLSQAKDSSDVLATHKEAHGLMPDYIIKVEQGN
jgi:hypothetical protein